MYMHVDMYVHVYIYIYIGRESVYTRNLTNDLRIRSLFGYLDPSYIPLLHSPIST